MTHDAPPVFGLICVSMVEIFPKALEAIGGLAAGMAAKAVNLVLLSSRGSRTCTIDSVGALWV